KIRPIAAASERLIRRITVLLAMTQSSGAPLADPATATPAAVRRRDCTEAAGAGHPCRACETSVRVWRGAVTQVFRLWRLARNHSSVERMPCSRAIVGFQPKAV